MQVWKSYKYKNITLIIFSLIIAFFLSRFDQFHDFLINIAEFGYIGVFLAGILFVSTFTIATGIVILNVFSEQFSAIEIAIVAGFGAVAGDFLIFRFFKNNLAHEITELYIHFDDKHHIKRVFNSKYFSWTIPVVGAIIIASPFPDELGVSLMGISKMKTYQFFLISFILNAMGILIIISTIKIIG